MTNLTDKEVCIGSLGQQKVYLNWSDVKDICTNAVAEAYEQTKKENTKLKTENKWYSEQLNEASKEIEKLKELLKRIRKELNDCPTCVEGSWKAELVDKIDQVLGEE